MAKFILNTTDLEKALGSALLDSVQLAQNLITDITPRDYKRPPQNINRKDGKIPVRKGGITSKNGNYYPQVTGNLKRSIAIEKVSNYEYKIGTLQGESEYAKFLEFGTVHMKPRSFLRKGIYDNKSEINANFKKRFKQVLNKI